MSSKGRSSDAAVRIGPLKISPVLDGVVRLPRSYYIGVESDNYAPLLDRRGGLSLPVGCFVVSGPHGHVLVDAGVGPTNLTWARGGRLPRSLQTLGVDPADISAVIVTHLHADHRGWLIPNGRPFFRNAIVYVGLAEIGSATQQVGGSDLKPLTASAQLRAVVENETEILPGVTMVSAPGHTPGHHVVRVSAGSREAVIVGDLFVTPLQIEDSKVVNVSDSEPELARAVRARFLRSLTAATVVGGPHFPQLRFGRVLAHDTGASFLPHYRQQDARDPGKQETAP